MTGRHTEGPPTVFGCALNYVTMRLLGVDALDQDLLSARNMLRKLGNCYCTCLFAAVMVVSMVSRIDSNNK